MPNIVIRFDAHWKSHRFKTVVESYQVIQRIGLCICVFDILEASDGRIGQGTGIVNVNGRPLQSTI